MSSMNIERSNEILDAIKSFSDNYSHGLIKIVLDSNGETYQLHSALLTFLHTRDDISDAEKNFERLVLIQKIVPVEELCDIITKIAETSKLSIEGFEDFNIEGSYSVVRFVTSKSRSGYLRSNWPSFYAEYRFGNSRALPRGPLVSKTFELYPDGNKAVIDFLGLTSASAENFILIQVPDYRLTIENLRISGNTITLEILPLNISQDKLVAIFYAHYESSRPYIGERDFYSVHLGPYDFKENQISIQIDSEYNYILAVVIERETGNIIDYREHMFTWYPREGVTIIQDELDFSEMIVRGENVGVEFKQELGNEFLETVVSFANTLGGVIFLGVADDTTIVGFRPKTEDQITNLITSNIDPVPDFNIRETEIDGKMITVVSIAPGDDKPYSHRQQGIFVRSGGTDRHAIRSDWERIYKEKTERGSLRPV